MRPQSFPFMVLAAGVVAAVALARKAPSYKNADSASTDSTLLPRRFMLAKDVPALDLRRGETLRIDPEALIYPGDVVALSEDSPEIVLARFHDELMHCTAGLVVRESRSNATSV